MALVEKIAHETPGVAHTVRLAGMSFLLQANAPTSARCSSSSTRSTSGRQPELTAEGIMDRLRQEFTPARSRTRMSLVRNSSPIPGLGIAGGYKLIVEDRGGRGLEDLQSETDELVRDDEEAAGPGRRVHPVPLEHAAALPGHRPDQGRVHGRCRSTT